MRSAPPRWRPPQRWDAGTHPGHLRRVARVLPSAFVDPQVYTNVGLDRREALAQVKASGHRAEIMQTGAKRLTDFLDDIGLLRGVGRRLWRASGTAGAAARQRRRPARAPGPAGRRHDVHDRRSPAAPADVPPPKRRGAPRQLLHAALALFAHRAPDEVSLDDVAEQAGVSRPLVYRYFPGGTPAAVRGRAQVRRRPARHCFDRPRDRSADRPGSPAPSTAICLRRPARHRLQRPAARRQRGRDLPDHDHRRRGAPGRRRRHPAPPRPSAEQPAGRGCG
ncbi:hypothetical protein SCALM49S_01581 [Streptomyces californicus]